MLISTLMFVLGLGLGAIFLWPLSFRYVFRPAIDSNRDRAKEFMQILADSLGGELFHVDEDTPQ